MKKAYTLLIFDWDGTLMDSTGQIVASFQAAIAACQLPARDDARIRQLIGLGIHEAMASLYPELPTSQVMGMLAQYRSAYLAPSNNQVLYPGVLDMLHALKAQGYELAVATGKSRVGLNRVLEETGLRDFFVATRTADECTSKPAPDMVNEILWQTTTLPEQALVIGDTDYDLLMAKSAGVDAVAVLGGAHPLERLQAAQPLTVLNAAVDLPAWLR